MESELKQDLEDVKAMMSPRPDGSAHLISPCMQSVIAAAALKFVTLITSEMNDKGRINLLRAFGIIGKLIKAAIEIVAIHKACK